jgi:hypothetical protein
MGENREGGVSGTEAGSSVASQLLIVNLGVVKPQDYAGDDKGNGKKNPHQRRFICMFHLLTLPINVLYTYRKTHRNNCNNEGCHP